MTQQNISDTFTVLFVSYYFTYWSSTAGITVFFCTMLDSGSLELTNKRPSGNIRKFAKGSRVESIPFTYPLMYGPIIGTYGSIKFTYARKYYAIWDKLHDVYDYFLELYDEQKNLLYKETGRDYPEKLTLKYDMTIENIVSENAKTFKLYNLPTTLPADSGTVWRDKDGYLRIV